MGGNRVVSSKQHIAAVDEDKSFHGLGPSLAFLQGLQRRRVESQPRLTPILTLEHVSKIYPMGELEVRALDEVDLQIYRGELLMVLGQSGSGKSTLLNVIGGMDRPTRGKVTYHDENGKTLSLDKASDSQLTRFRRTYVGFVF